MANAISVMEISIEDNPKPCPYGNGRTGKYP